MAPNSSIRRCRRRARVTLAHKAVNDTTVRAPLRRHRGAADGLDGRLRHARHEGRRGRADHYARVELTVPEQFVAGHQSRAAVSVLRRRAFAGRTFQGQVRFVSPSLRADQRALTVEASVPNAKGELKPGMFATALVEQARKLPAVLVPAAAVRTVSGTSRVFVVAGDRAEERIVTTGQNFESLVEITTGLKYDETVATENVNQLVDGIKVK
jgi:RND family efflux transporter MFP subunit